MIAAVAREVGPVKERCDGQSCGGVHANRVVWNAWVISKAVSGRDSRFGSGFLVLAYA